MNRKARIQGRDEECSRKGKEKGEVKHKVRMLGQFGDTRVLGRQTVEGSCVILC